MRRPVSSRRAVVSVTIAGLAAVSVVTACGEDVPSNPVEPPSPPAADTVDVFTPGNVFSPTAVTIDTGDVIRFRITESPDTRGHNVIFVGSQPGRPADIPVVKDTAILRAFREAGVYPYSCTVHPGMDGEVTVR